MKRNICFSAGNSAYKIRDSSNTMRSYMSNISDIADDMSVNDDNICRKGNTSKHFTQSFIVCFERYFHHREDNIGREEYVCTETL